MRLFLFALVAFFCLQPHVIWAEAIPITPPADKSSLKKHTQRPSDCLFNQKKKCQKRCHPTCQQAAGGILLFIGTLLFGLAAIAGSVVGFFFFLGTGAIILLSINILLSLILAIFLLMNIDPSGNDGVWIIPLVLIVWFFLELFVWGALLAIPVMWIIGLIFLVLLVGGSLWFIISLNNSYSC